jgi:carnitine-CoA ligase
MREHGTARLLRDLVGEGRATIPQLLAARAARTPDAPFVLDRSRVWTYAAAWSESVRFAGFLEGRISGSDRVASYLANAPEALWTWFGTLTSGRVHVSINRAHRGPVLSDMLARSRAALLVTDMAAWPLLPELRELGFRQILFIDEVPEAARSAELAVLSWEDVAISGEGVCRASDPASAATVIFTSGTTGRSKAVRLPHNMYCRGGAHVAEAFGFRADDVFHAWLPLAHIAGQLHITMSAIAAGASLALYKTFSRSRFWDEVAEARATVFAGLSNLLAMLLMDPERPEDARNSLRIGLIGNPPPALQAAFERRFGVVIRDTYGMTECEPLTLPTVTGRPPGSCGRPGPDFELAILDPQDRPVAAGSVGRIVMRPRVPDVMMQAYEGDEETTVAAWRNLWFHTQDLGRIDERGFVYFVERLKDSIRRGGENISPAEVEQTLSTHPDVKVCAVVGVPDPLVGEEVKAAIVLKPGAAADAVGIRAFAKGRMASFMVPRYIEFLEALPLSEIGKVQREELRRIGPKTWDAQRKHQPSR